MTEEKQEAVDFERAKECLAAFSEAWDSSDVYILAAPVDEEGSINLGHPYVRTKDTPEGFGRNDLKGGRFIHFGGSGKLEVDNKKYSALLWDGGGRGGGVMMGGEWEEGNAWTELARKSGAELLRGDYGVSVTGGSPTPFWAIVVVGELWETEWRKPAPGDDHFLFPAYVASIETWKRIIQRREQEVFSENGIGLTTVLARSGMLIGLVSLIAWMVYRRKRLKRRKNLKVDSHGIVAVWRVVLQKGSEKWHDPVWSKVFANGIWRIVIVAFGIFLFLVSWALGLFP